MALTVRYNTIQYSNIGLLALSTVPYSESLAIFASCRYITVICRIFWPCDACGSWPGLPKSIGMWCKQVPKHSRLVVTVTNKVRPIPTRYAAFHYNCSASYSWLVAWYTVVELRSLTSELSVFCARPAADEWPFMWINRPL